MQEDQPITMTQRELKMLMRDTVNETLLSLGIEYTNPIEMQKDFKSIRDFRVAQEEIKSEGRKYLVYVFLTGVAALLWLGFKEQIVSFFIIK